MSAIIDIQILPDGRMDTKNAAAYLGRKPKTLAQWRSANIGPPYVKKGRVYYYKHDVDNWLREGLVSRRQGLPRAG